MQRGQLQIKLKTNRIARGIGAKPLFKLKTQFFEFAGGGAANPYFHTGNPISCMHFVALLNTKSAF
jgi:hypothetical protein